MIDNLRRADFVRRADRHGVLSCDWFPGGQGDAGKANLLSSLALHEPRPRREFLGIERNDRLECARFFHLVAAIFVHSPPTCEPYQTAALTALLNQ
jgi:hypothetical protein